MKTKDIMNLPTPSNISFWWNFGSLISMMLVIQIITGTFLSMFYCPNINLAFESTMNIYRNINFGWIMRNSHSNGASFFFMFLFMHMSRGLYYSSFKMYKTWMSGMLMLLTSMMIAFMGYILPWGQMSFWGATVITNLMSAIPYLGNSILLWMWGGFNLNNLTLNRMFTMHFIFPFILLIMTMMHIMFIHEKGSLNPLGTNSNIDKIPFHIYFTIKDLLSMTLFLMMMFTTIMIWPYKLSDPENFIPANPLKTPPHIKPEWYFLMSYSILRSIPNKLGGILAMGMSILIFLTLPMMKKNFMSSQFCPFYKILMWNLMIMVLLLMWFSTMPMMEPFTKMNQMLTFFYFLNFPLMFFMNWLWKMLIK
uniref:Cytochrome b n=1 Tax=Elateroidea sp. 2 KM-2017 TaxID=2219425 RepID=A0A346RG89_9COLE|nr:cytochrome b [Elateroidea sp. 2 KM-2017]